MCQNPGVEFKIASINLRICSSSLRTRATRNGEWETAYRPLESSAKRGTSTKCGTTSLGGSREFGSRGHIGSHQAFRYRFNALRSSKRERCFARYAHVFGKSSRSIFSVTLLPLK